MAMAHYTSNLTLDIVVGAKRVLAGIDNAGSVMFQNQFYLAYARSWRPATDITPSIVRIRPHTGIAGTAVASVVPAMLSMMESKEMTPSTTN